MTPPTAADLVARYATGFNAAFTTEHRATSPLGLWLLLALAGPATRGTARTRLDETLGTDADTARDLAGQLLADPHPAVAAAVAAWSDPSLTAWDAFAATLPPPVTRGPVPTQGDADAWAARHTDGMIARFPLAVTDDTLLVLASALATRISWETPLARVPGTDLGGPFGARVARALHLRGGALFDTEAAGLVAVAAPRSTSGLSVLSVIAAVDVRAAAVHEAAHQVATALRDPADDTTVHARPVDLFDLPLGPGHAWDLTERVQELRGGRSQVSEHESYLPAWSAEANTDLASAPGVGEVLVSLAALVDPTGAPLPSEVRQSTVAAYTAEGFEAAAVTAMGIRRGGMPASTEVTVRRATTRFNRPHAVLATAEPVLHALDTQRPDRRWYGVPVFSAWVATPDDA